MNKKEKIIFFINTFLLGVICTLITFYGLAALSPNGQVILWIR